MSRYQPPEIGLEQFNCPHCGALAHQFWHTVAAREEKRADVHFGYRDDLEEFLSGPDFHELSVEKKADMLTAQKRQQAGEVFFHDFIEPYRIPVVSNLHISKCFSCKRLAVWIDGSLTYPKTFQTIPPAEDMPEQVRVLYLEAASICEASPRAAAALLRTAVEVLCNQINQGNDKIFDGIGKLVKKGLDPQVQKAMDVVRVTGNDAVHPGQIDKADRRSDVDSLFRLINIIVDRLITIPLEIEDLFQKLPEEKKAAIGKRDGPKP